MHPLQTLSRPVSAFWKRIRPFLVPFLVLFPWSLLLFGGLGVAGGGAHLLLGLLLGLPAAAAVLLLVRRLLAERRTVRLRTRIRVADPLVPGIGRSTLRVEVLSVRIERGRARRREECCVEVRLRGASRPEALAWCSRQVRAQLDATAQRIRRERPGARVVVEGTLGVEELARRIEAARTARPRGFGERAWSRTVELGHLGRRWVSARLAGHRSTDAPARSGAVLAPHPHRAARSFSSREQAW